MTARPKDGRGQRVCVAQIGAAHGLKGEVRLFSFTGQPDAVAQYGTLETEDGKRHFEIETLRAAKDHFVARLRGVNDRNDAEALRNMKLYVARDRLPETEDDEFYHADLIGLSAIDKVGQPVGTVVAVHNFGAGDILEIGLLDGSKQMFAFDEQTVPRIDIAAGQVTIDPPAETEGEDETHPR